MIKRDPNTIYIMYLDYNDDRHIYAHTILSIKPV